MLLIQLAQGDARTTSVRRPRGGPPTANKNTVLNLSLQTVSVTPAAAALAAGAAGPALPADLFQVILASILTAAGQASATPELPVAPASKLPKKDAGAESRESSAVALVAAVPLQLAVVPGAVAVSAPIASPERVANLASVDSRSVPSANVIRGQAAEAGPTQIELLDVASALTTPKAAPGIASATPAVAATSLPPDTGPGVAKTEAAVVAPAPVTPAVSPVATPAPTFALPTVLPNFVSMSATADLPTSTPLPRRPVASPNFPEQLPINLPANPRNRIPAPPSAPAETATTPRSANGIFLQGALAPQVANGSLVSNVPVVLPVKNASPAPAGDRASDARSAERGPGADTTKFLVPAELPTVVAVTPATAGGPAKPDHEDGTENPFAPLLPPAAALVSAATPSVPVVGSGAGEPTPVAAFVSQATLKPAPTPHQMLDQTPLPADAGTVSASNSGNRFVDRDGQSEMHVGWSQPGWGRIEVHTVLRDNQVGVTIASERSDLRALAAAEMPGLHNHLQRQQLELQEMRFTTAGRMGEDATGSSSSRQNSSGQHPNQSHGQAPGGNDHPRQPSGQRGMEAVPEIRDVRPHPVPEPEPLPWRERPPGLGSPAVPIALNLLA
jgi:hypothetical protein